MSAPGFAWQGLVMFHGAVSAMLLMKEVLHNVDGSSFWLAECGRVFGLLGRVTGAIGWRPLPHTAGGFRWVERCHRAGKLRRRQRLRSVALYEAPESSCTHFSVLERAKEECGQCPHFSPRIGSDSRRTVPDSACFRHFPLFQGPRIAFESHLGHTIFPGQRNFLL